MRSPGGRAGYAGTAGSGWRCFPACGWARDLDHREEWPEGKTVSSNLFPPCRGHHRLKTFTDWTYDYDPATGFTWTSPQGYRYTDPGSHPGSRRHTG